MGVSGSAFFMAGGLIGNLGEGTSLTDSSVTANVSGQFYTGGAVGYNEGEISNVQVLGNVTVDRSGLENVQSGAGAIAGGIAGLNYGPISQVSFDGNVIANGIVSLPEYRAPNDPGWAGIAGGIVGLNRGSVDQAEARGTVSGTGAVGGIVGTNEAGGVTIAFHHAIVTNSIADNDLSGGVVVGTIAGAQSVDPVNMEYYGYLPAELSNNFSNADRNPDIAQVGSNVIGVISDDPGVPLVNGGGSLTSDQLADGGIRDAVLSGGDVEGAIDDFDARNQPVLPPDDPVIPPDDPEVPPIAVDPEPPEEADPDVPPVAVDPEPPEEADPDVPPVAVDPDIPSNVVDYDTVQVVEAAVAQARDSGQQLLEGVISGALAGQTAGFENSRVPLDQLMAHLTREAVNAETPDANFASGVRNISVDEERYSLEGEENGGQGQ
jgi:hypothetical protein